MKARVLAVLLLAVTLVACKTDQTLVLIGGTRLDAVAVERDPLRVLPSGALFLGTLDAEALFRSQLGAQVAAIVSSLVPLGPESNFVPSRDVKRVYAGIYAMQGADFAAVSEGTFDVAAIQRAAQARAATPSGVPLVVTRYAEYELYTVANIGFVTLTPKLILSGNETGIRRALDRLRYGRLDVGLPAWMTELLAQTKAAPAAPGAPVAERPAFAVVGDVAGQGVLSATSAQLPFLDKMTMMRVLGNFKAPGMNVVGSLTYSDEAAGKAGAQNLAQLQQLAYLASMAATWGFGGRLPDMNVQQQGNDVAFATELDTAMLNLVLGVVGEALKAR
jgi:hypothetical protein